MAAKWRIFPDPDTVAKEVAAAIMKEAEHAISLRGVFNIVLAGGTTPKKIYQRLAHTASKWDAWQIYFGDERCLPVGDPERNSTMVLESWLNQIDIPEQNVHAMPAELGAEKGAQRYLPFVQEAQPFDLVLLGMGEDGHTASLFPGHSHDLKQLVHSVHDAPMPPPDRISLSLSAINTAKQVFIIVTGKGKRDAVKKWRRGDAIPIAEISGKEIALVFIDAAANAA